MTGGRRAQGRACVRARDAVLLMITPEADCFGGSNAQRKSADSSLFPKPIRRIVPSSMAAAADDEGGGGTQSEPTTLVGNCCKRAAPLGGARQQAAGFDCLVVNAVDGTEAGDHTAAGGARFTGAVGAPLLPRIMTERQGPPPPVPTTAVASYQQPDFCPDKNVCILVAPHQRSLRSGPRPPQLSSSCFAFPFEQFPGCKPKLHRRVCFHHIV